jgi:hypothetical protein
MSTLFVLSLIALFIGVGIVALIEGDPGYVLLYFGWDWFYWPQAFVSFFCY